MSEFINTIDVLGDDAVIDSIIMRTITEFKDNRVEKVGEYAFYDCTALETVELPNCKTIDRYAFQKCTSLRHFDLSKVTAVHAYSFSESGLEEADCPVCTSLSSNSFARCNNMTRASFPLLTTIAGNSMERCTALTDVYAPNVTNIQSNGLRGCTALERLDFPALTSIQGYALAECSALTTLILRNTAGVVTLAANGLEHNTDKQFSGGTGFIYVPKALVDSYKAATNWSAYASQIRAIEDYPNITGG